MSKKNLGSNIDDFLKKENIFEEAQAQAIKEVVAWQLAKAMNEEKDFQGADGGVVEDKPAAGRPHSRPETRHHTFEFAAGRGFGEAAGGD
jgi:hypothetical protein